MYMEKDVLAWFTLCIYFVGYFIVSDRAVSWLLAYSHSLHDCKENRKKKYVTAGIVEKSVNCFLRVKNQKLL